MNRSLLFWGAINAALAVALGAFGAHGLKHYVAESALQTWHTAAQYHFYHALGLILIGILTRDFSHAARPGYLMLAGIVLFCGSLYALVLSGVKILGAITPFGGLCFIVAWLWLAWVVWREQAVKN